jgi:hypothetical protein
MKTEKPAHNAYAAHVLVCRAAEHGRWCQVCLDLDKQASAEMFRRTADRATAGVR